MKLNNFYNELETFTEITNIDENRSFIMTTIKDLFSKSYGKVKTSLTLAARKVMKFFKENGLEKEIIDIINKSLGTGYHSFNQLVKIPIKENINEGFKEWYDEAKMHGYNALAFYPLLNMFMEIDKLIKGQDYSMRILIVYFVLWVGVIAGKITKDKISQKAQIKALGAKI
jgi:uncharacterized protein (UPF0335 family)